MMAKNYQDIFLIYQKKLSGFSRKLLDLENQKFQVRESMDILLEELVSMKKDFLEWENRNPEFYQRLIRFLEIMRGEQKKSGYSADEFHRFHAEIEDLVKSLSDDFRIKELSFRSPPAVTESGNSVKTMKKTVALDKFLMMRNGTMHFLVPYSQKITARKIISCKTAKIKYKNITYHFHSLPGTLDNEKKIRTAVLLIDKNGKNNGILGDEIERVFYYNARKMKGKLEITRYEKKFLEYFIFKGNRYYLYPPDHSTIP